MAKEVYIPDIGDYKDVDIIEVAVKEGDSVAFEDTLITLETEKATMDIPSPFAGVITKMHVSIGDKVSEGSLMLSLDAVEEEETATIVSEAVVSMSSAGGSSISVANGQVISSSVSHSTSTISSTVVPPQKPQSLPVKLATEVYAGPGVRRFARELGVDLSHVLGTGIKGRITKLDVQNHVKQALQTGNANTKGNSLGFELPAMPKVDFAKFGEIEQQPLSRVKKISGSFLHRNWVHIPHVTQFEEADVTVLEKIRKEKKSIAEKEKVKLTPLLFIMKAIVAALKEYPQFNSSLDPSGENLILKKYFNIGIAVDTPNGLVVPVLRDVEKKGIMQLAREMRDISQRARDGKLSATDMQGGCFSISSLGGIGGTYFTPIINAPEVAILGVSKLRTQPVYIDGKFEPRLILPLALSYDHRVIDGAEAARFVSFIAKQLADPQDILLG